MRKSGISQAVFLTAVLGMAAPQANPGILAQQQTKTLTTQDLQKARALFEHEDSKKALELFQSAKEQLADISYPDHFDMAAIRAHEAVEAFESSFKSVIGRPPSNEDRTLFFGTDINVLQRQAADGVGDQAKDAINRVITFSKKPLLERMLEDKNNNSNFASDLNFTLEYHLGTYSKTLEWAGITSLKTPAAFNAALKDKGFDPLLAVSFLQAQHQLDEVTDKILESAPSHP